MDKSKFPLETACNPFDVGAAIVFEWRSRRYVACNGFHFRRSSKDVAGYSLITVIAAEDDEPITPSWLQNYLSILDSSCDVYSREAFLKDIIITDPVKGRVLSAESVGFLKHAGAKWVELTQPLPKPLADQLSSGPYLYHDGVLRRVYRLYDDTHGAFLTGLKPKHSNFSHGTYHQLSTSGKTYGCISIAVASRAHEVGNASPPRLRVVVKDLFALKGLRTFLNNRSYDDIKSPSLSTTAVIESLRRDQAYILGMTKLSSMIAREEPLDAIESPTCFNPRGDGYQSPAGSSSGSAAAVAAYDWVDVGIGSDTSGSGRRPAMANGVWQFRPSHDLIDCKEMVKTWPGFDTPCVFARDFGKLERVLSCWIPRVGAPVQGRYGAKLYRQFSPLKRYEIIYPTEYFLSITNPDQHQLLNNFIEDLRLHLGHDVITFTHYYSFYHSTSYFRQAYARKHKSQKPYVIPFVQRRWALGAAVTDAEHDAANRRLIIHKNWLHKTLFTDRGDGKKPATEVLVVLPIGNVRPNYRDEPSPSPEQQSAVDELFLPPILGAPDVVVPIGEWEYDSKITGKKEYLPVMVDLMGAPGRDYQLLEAVEMVMKKSGRVMEVATGSRMFPDKEREKRVGRAW